MKRHLYTTNSYTLLQVDMLGFSGYKYNIYAITDGKVYWTHKDNITEFDQHIGGYNPKFIIPHVLRYCGSSDGDKKYTDNDFNIQYPIIKFKREGNVIERDLNVVFKPDDCIKIYLQEDENGAKLFDNYDKKYAIFTSLRHLFEDDFDVIQIGHVGDEILKMI